MRFDERLSIQEVKVLQKITHYFDFIFELKFD